MAIFNQIIIQIFLFCFGGLVYTDLEILFRGFSHWTMFIVGGLCFTIIGLLNENADNKKILFQYQCLIGTGVITALEFISGCIVNLILQWNVWDYSDRHFNLFGQICLHHTVLYWLPISAIAILLDDFLRYTIFDEDLPQYYFKKKK